MAKGIYPIEKRRGLFEKGHVGYKSRIGKKWSKKIRNKIGDALKGEKSRFWKGGISSQYRRKVAPRKMPSQCEICGAFGSEFKRGLCFDHDHKTGKFRGWICTRCNVTIGLVKENTETLLAIINYIKSNKV